MLATMVMALAMTSDLAAHSDLLAQIEHIDQTIEEQGISAELLLKRGDLYRRHEDYDAAARDFDAVRELDPENDPLDFFVGRLELETGKPEAARVSLERYLNRHPEHARAWSLLAEANVQLGQARVAADQFGLAIDHSASPSPELYRAQVFSLLAAGNSARPEAEAVTSEGLGVFGPEVNLLGLAVDMALSERQAEEATALLNRLPAGLERLPAWAQRLAWAACDTGSCWKQAEDHLQAQIRAFMQTGNSAG